MTRWRTFLPLLLLGVLPAGGAAGADTGAGWRPVADRDGVQVFRRAGSGGIDALRAEGRIASPPAVLRDVLLDAGRYQEFMPYTKESRLLEARAGFRLSYQRVSLPLVSERDYVIALECIGLAGAAGYRLEWTARADGRAPVRDGVVRVTRNHGEWELRSDGPSATYARYFLETDPGGSLPAFVVNIANTRAVPEVFAAVAARAARTIQPMPAAQACPRTADAA